MLQQILTQHWVQGDETMNNRVPGCKGYVLSEDAYNKIILNAKQEVFDDIHLIDVSDEETFEDAYNSIVTEIRRLRTKHLHPIINKDISTESP